MLGSPLQIDFRRTMLMSSVVSDVMLPARGRVRPGMLFRVAMRRRCRADRLSYFPFEHPEARFE